MTIHCRPDRTSGAVVLSALSLLLVAGCGSNTTTTTTQTSGGGGSSTSQHGGTTSITVSGQLSGPMNSPTVACVNLGQAGFQVAVQGTVSGTKYLLKFDAPMGTTDLSTATTADIVVLFIQLPAGASWGADPRAKKGTGTIVVNATDGTVNIHLIPSQGTPATAPIDVAGSYACSSTSTG